MTKPSWVPPSFPLLPISPFPGSILSLQLHLFHFHQGLDPSSSLVAQLVNNLPVLKEILVQFLGWEDPLEKGWATHSSILGLLWVVQRVKNLPANAGDLGSIPGLGQYPGEGNGYPFQYSGLENSIDRGDWQAIVHGVSKSQTWLSDFHTLDPSWLS